MVHQGWLGQNDKMSRMKKARKDGRNLFGHDREGTSRWYEISNTSLERLADLKKPVVIKEAVQNRTKIHSESTSMPR